jgi:hypothetical protein
MTAYTYSHHGRRVTGRLSTSAPRKVLSTWQSGSRHRLYPHRLRKCRTISDPRAEEMSLLANTASNVVVSITDRQKPSLFPRASAIP